MKKFKGFIAMAIALTTVASSASVMAFAESGGLSGDGSVEGVVKKEVFNVVLPTVSESDTTFDFILDPQGLIAATSQAAYSGKTFEASKYLFFNNVAAGKTNDYSSESDALTAYNLSNKAVDLTIKGTVTDADGITFVSTTPTVDKAEIQLQLDVDGTATAFATADGETTVNATKNLAALADSNFEVKYNSGDGSYSYALKSGVDKDTSGVAKATFKLVGEASKNDDGTAWAGIKDVAPKVDITWEIKSPFVTGPSATATVTANETQLVMPFDLGSDAAAATGIVSVSYKNDQGVWSGADKSLYTISDNKLIWNAACSQYLSSYDSAVRITFNDTANTVAEIKVVGSGS